MSVSLWPSKRQRERERKRERERERERESLLECDFDKKERRKVGFEQA